MTGFGTKAFTDPDDYRTRLVGAEVGLVVTGRPLFEAQLSWVDMRCLHLLAIEEKAPRVAFISLPPASLVFSFTLARNAVLMWNGLGLQRGSFVLHASGERFHQRATGAVRWGLIAVSPQDLARYSCALLGADLSRRAAGLLHPSARSIAELLRLHAQAAHLARSFSTDSCGMPLAARLSNAECRLASDGSFATVSAAVPSSSMWPAVLLICEPRSAEVSFSADIMPIEAAGVPAASRCAFW